MRDGKRLSLADLSEAVQMIGDSPDPEEAVRLLCEAVVPRLADAAAVYVDGRVRHRVDPGGRLPSRWTDDRLRRPMLLDHHLAVVPLRACGKPVGCALLARDRTRAAFAEVDLFMAGQLGVPAALTLFHGRLHRQQLETVETLQRGLRPGNPPVLPGLEITHRYQHAAERVGGDWFDVIPLPGSRVALVVGHVVGHGLSAAVIMGQFRTAVRTLASLDLPAEQVVHSLDEIAQRLAAQTLATIVYCVYDPVLRRCVLAGAGHLPPILVDRTGQAQVLNPPRCPPIGLGRARCATMEIAAEDGSMLVLYTGGLVAERGRGVRHNVDKLRRRFADGTREGVPIEELCDSVLPISQADDATLLAIRFRGIPSEHVAQWFLEPQAQTPARVRGLVTRTLASWGLESMTPVAVLLASELVTNALRHTTRPIPVRLLRTESLLFEVSDDDHKMPVLRESDPLDDHGRGLYLVDKLAERWGTSQVAGGKVVWFSLPIPGAHA